MTRSQYSLPSKSSDDPRGLTEYIRATAQKYGIDPEVALRVARSEGLRSFKSGVIQKSGKEEPSFGAFQLYTGGGLGNEFKKATGLDPADPKNEKETIDYALKTAAKVGWGPWHGAKNTGIGEFEGISGGKAAADPAAGYGGIGSDAAASERAATAVKGTQTDTSVPETAQAAPAAPTGDFIDRLKNSPTGMQGVGEAISGLGQATAGTGLNKGMYDTPTRPAVVAAPGMMTPAMTPMVNPQVAETQRQQLASAMQRLNSGKLY